jgi:hypothetical protein
MNNITADEIENYIEENYGTMKHDKYSFADAINEVSYDLESWSVDPWDIFLLVIENKPIKDLHTHSYGFQTRAGRGIIEKFQSYYYEMV